jgi:hypothetical protein
MLMALFWEVMEPLGGRASLGEGATGDVPWRVRDNESSGVSSSLFPVCHEVSSSSVTHGWLFPRSLGATSKMKTLPPVQQKNFKE